MKGLMVGTGFAAFLIDTSGVEGLPGKKD